MVLNRLISRDRLDRGLISSARDSREVCCILFGVLLIVLSSSWITFIEGNLVFQEREVAEARREAFEEDCSTTNTASVGHVFHLNGCSVHGAVNWMDIIFSEFDNGTSMKELEYFSSNFVSPDDLWGVRFRVNVMMYSRRRSASWEYVDGVANIPSTDMDADVVHIGAWRATDSIVENFPFYRVPLRPSPLYHPIYHDRGGVLPERLDSTNVNVYNDALYWSETPSDPENDDVKIFFTVANDKAVSVVAAADVSKHLVPWNSSQERAGSVVFTGYSLGLVESGSVSVAAMLDHALNGFHGDAWTARCMAWIVTWVGTICAMFAADVIEMCSKNEEDRHGCQHHLYAIGSSCIVAFFITTLFCATAALAFRSSLFLVVVASLIVCAGAFGAAFNLGAFRAGNGGVQAQASQHPTEYLVVVAQSSEPSIEYQSLAGESVSRPLSEGTEISIPRTMKFMKWMALGAMLGICSSLLMVLILTFLT